MWKSKEPINTMKNYKIKKTMNFQSELEFIVS